MSPHKLLSKPKIGIRKKGEPRSHQIHDTHTRDLERELHLGKLDFKASTKSDFSFHLGAGQRETQPTFGEMVAGPWKIPWTEGPGGLQSMGSLEVGHD